jgi:hypothetical protein
MPKAQDLVLTQSQAACLIALRHGNENQSKIEGFRTLTKNTSHQQTSSILAPLALGI